MSNWGVGDHADYFIENALEWTFSDFANDGKTEELDKKLDSSLPSYREEGNEEGKAVRQLIGKKKSGECSKSAKETKRDNEKNDETGNGELGHGSHIWTERERRKKMRDHYDTLHSLLPQIPKKADKFTIVDEAFTYISELQNTLQKLEKRKSEKLASHGKTREAFIADHGLSSNNLAMCTANPVASQVSVPQFPVKFCSFTSQNVAFSVCGDVAHISICSRKRPGLVTAICYVLEKHKLEVVSAHVSSDQISSSFMIQVHANGTKKHFPEGYPVEEIFKIAAAELMSCVAS